jgi:hypothetical protein
MIERDEKIDDRACASWEKMSFPHGADWDHWQNEDADSDAERLSRMAARMRGADRDAQKAA